MFKISTEKEILEATWKDIVKFFFMFIFEGGKGSRRGGQGTCFSREGPLSQQRAQCRARTHDLSPSWMLNRLKHPGTPGKRVIQNTKDTFVQILESLREILLSSFSLIKNANGPVSLNYKLCQNSNIKFYDIKVKGLSFHGMENTDILHIIIYLRGMWMLGA